MRNWFLILFFFIFLFGAIKLFVEESQKISTSRVDAWENEPSADCAVVLTGGPGRIKEGLDLLIRKQVRQLIISGVNPQVTVYDLFPQLALYPQISERQIILEKRSETTFGNAQQSLPLVEALQCHTVLLVTSYLHIYRSMATFKATFPQEVQLIPYSVVGNQMPPTRTEILVETLKSLFYSLWAYK